MATIKNIPINTHLSLKRCWDMVNSIKVDDAEETRRRCQIAEEWLTANEVISVTDYDALMMTVAYLHRETYHYDRW